MELALTIVLMLIGIAVTWLAVKWILKTAITLIAFALVILVGTFVFSVITGTSMTALVVEPIQQAKELITNKLTGKATEIIDIEFEKLTNSTKQKINEVLEE